MKHRLVTLAAVVAVLFGATTSARAQDVPAFEFSVGYQLLRTGEFSDDLFDDEDEDCELFLSACEPTRTFPIGVNVDAVRNFGPIGIVGEIGWAFDSEDALFPDDIGEEVPDLDELDAKFDTWHAAGGVRYTGGTTVRPYGQVLVGVVGSRFKLDFDDEDVTYSQKNLMVQPGVGVTFSAGGVGVFGQVDYRRVFKVNPLIETIAIEEGDLDDEDASEFDRNDFRFVVGVRLSL